MGMAQASDRTIVPSMHTINVTGWCPGTLPHVKQVLKGKHGKEVTILFKVGGEVTYLV